MIVNDDFEAGTLALIGVFAFFMLFACSLFLIPIIYAGHTARVKGAIIVTLVSLIIFLPRAFFISPYPDPLLRMVLFTLGAGTIGCLHGRLRNESERNRELEARLREKQQGE